MEISSLLIVGGAGKIGTCIARGIIEGDILSGDRITVTARHQSTLDDFSVAEVGTSLDNAEAFDQLAHPAVILSVHPDEVDSALEELQESEQFSECELLISVVTGVSTARITSAIPSSIPVVRAMPNLPTRIQQGVTVICPGANTDTVHLDAARHVFKALGEVVQLDEKHMEAATGLSGCGPAFAFQMLESLAHGGVQVGLPRKAALQLASATLEGAAKMVRQSEEHPAVFKDDVTTPGGCTVSALSKLEKRGLKSALIEAVETATQRAGQLSEE